MTIYDEAGKVLEAPDLSMGWVEQKRRLVASHPATEAVTHLEVMPGTDGLRRLVVDTPAGLPGTSMRTTECITPTPRMSWPL